MLFQRAESFLNSWFWDAIPSEDFMNDHRGIVGLHHLLCFRDGSVIGFTIVGQQVTSSYTAHSPDLRFAFGA